MNTIALPSIKSHGQALHTKESKLLPLIQIVNSFDNFKILDRYTINYMSQHKVYLDAYKNYTSRFAKNIHYWKNTHSSAAISTGHGFGRY